MIWEGGKPIDLGVFSGGTNSSASGGASNSRAAGTSDFNDPVNGVVPHAFLYAGGKLQDLGTLGGSQSQGNGIDEFGAVAGNSFTASDAATHAFVSNPFNSNQLVDLGTLGGTNSAAYGINDFGWVAGTSQTTATDLYGNQISDAVVWNALTKTAFDFGGLGGTFAQLNAINDLGVVTGWANLADSTTHAVIGFAGKLTDIGTLGGTYAQGNAINLAGAVVGFSNTTGNADVHAFVWTRSGGLVDLNTLLPGGSPWVLMAANGISDQGDIVGYGTINGESHAFSWKLAAYGAKDCFCR
ncbi:MAG: hypothetical protein JO022_20950 [Acidobacteriaceae bacterium]|nr:hypothetical protein [Acidobacteriaceae bacterium]